VKKFVELLNEEDFGAYLKNVLDSEIENKKLSEVTLQNSLRLLRKTLGTALIKDKNELVKATLVLGVRCSQEYDRKLDDYKEQKAVVFAKQE